MRPERGLRLFEPHELRHVADVVNDALDVPAAGVEDRRVNRTPVAFFERAVRPPDVVPLDRHRVGLTAAGHVLERRPQVANAGGVGVGGVVGERVEQPPTDQLVAGRHGGAEVRVVDPDDGVVRVGRQQEVRRGRGREDRIEIQFLHTTAHSPCPRTIEPEALYRRGGRVTRRGARDLRPNHRSSREGPARVKVNPRRAIHPHRGMTPPPQSFAASKIRLRGAETKGPREPRRHVNARSVRPITRQLCVARRRPGD